MSKKKLLENLVFAVLVFLSLKFVIFPGLESDNLFINGVALTSFFLLVVLAIFGRFWKYTDKN